MVCSYRICHSSTWQEMLAHGGTTFPEPLSKNGETATARQRKPKRIGQHCERLTRCLAICPQSAPQTTPMYEMYEAA